MPTRHASFLLALLLAALTTVAGAQTSDETEQILARAISQHEKGELESAIRDYRAYLAVRPERVEARSNLGAAYARLGRYEEAIAEYTAALARRPELHAVRFNLAVAYYKAARYVLAARELGTVVGAEPGNRNARLLLADCHLRLGEFKQIIASLAPLETEAREDRAVAYLLGMAYLNDGQVERGQVLIDRILRDGESGEAHLLMGTAFLMAHDHRSALKEFRRALEINPQLPSAHSFLGQTLLRMGNTDEAMAAFRRELELNPNDFDANLQMGILLKQEQRYDEALSVLDRALRVRQGELNVRFYIASIMIAQGKIVEATSRLEAVTKDAPDFVEAHVLLASAYYRQKRRADGDREQAIVTRLNAERQARQPGAREANKTSDRPSQP
jgi:tetratricopeptide (TPR) repeat protein